MNSRVYIVDGDPAVRDSLATLLGLNGHEAVTFATGSEFLTQRDRSKQQCVICEDELPDTTGMAIFQTLCAHRGTATSPLPFALLLSCHDPQRMLRAHRAGILHVFCKPLVNRRLLAFVAALGEAPREPY